jgi:hypothetical protein
VFCKWTSIYSTDSENTAFAERSRSDHPILAEDIVGNPESDILHNRPSALHSISSSMKVVCGVRGRTVYFSNCEIVENRKRDKGLYDMDSNRTAYRGRRKAAPGD